MGDPYGIPRPLSSSTSLAVPPQAALGARL